MQFVLKKWPSSDEKDLSESLLLRVEVICHMDAWPSAA